MYRTMKLHTKSVLAGLAALAIPVIAGPAVAQQTVAPLTPTAPAASKPTVPAPKSTGAAAATPESQAHPRIVRAIRDLDDAVRYMQAAPHDFGGHKAKAIQDAKAAIAELKEAVKYRAPQDAKSAAPSAVGAAPSPKAGNTTAATPTQKLPSIMPKTPQ